MYRLRPTTARKRKGLQFNDDDSGCVEEITETFNKRRGEVGSGNSAASKLVVIKTYLCENCDFNTNDEIKLIRHQSNHHNSQESCDSEKLRTSVDSDMRNGDEEIDGCSKIYSCSQCKYTTPYKYTLKRHTLSHTGVKSFQCPICLASFAYKWNMERHQRLVHLSQSREIETIVIEDNDPKEPQLESRNVQEQEIFVSDGDGFTQHSLRKDVVGSHTDGKEIFGREPQITKVNLPCQKDLLTENENTPTRNSQKQAKKKGKNKLGQKVKNTVQLNSQTRHAEITRKMVNQESKVEEVGNNDEDKNTKTNNVPREKKNLINRRSRQPLKYQTFVGLMDKFKCGLCDLSLSTKRGLRAHIIKFHYQKFSKCTCCKRCRLVSNCSAKVKKRISDRNLLQKRMCEKFSDNAYCGNKNDVNNLTALVNSFLNSSFADVLRQTILSTFTLEHPKEMATPINESEIDSSSNSDATSTEESIHEFAVELLNNDHLDEVRNERVVADNDCEKCGKSFANNVKLKRHIYRVHCEPRFECDVCKKKFKRKEGMLLHLNTHKPKAISDSAEQHVPVKAFQCESCEARFVCRDYLNRHVLRLHANLRYSCDFCKMKYKTENSLLNHKFKKHPEVGIR